MKKENTPNRARHRLEMVRNLLLAEVAFQEIFERYQRGDLRFSDIENWVDDKGKSLLYNLKEQSHSLFRTRAKGQLRRNEWLLDLVIGSIFHEAMKLRENVYQLEAYRPRYLHFKTRMRKTSHAYERDSLQKFERIISRAEQGLREGMEVTQSLFKDALEQLIDFLRQNSKDPYLIRMLLDHRSLLGRAYGSRKAKEIFDLMFQRGLLDAYSLAGRSYLEGGHYDLSSACFSKALRMAPSDPQLQFLAHFSLGMKAYYRNAPSKALFHFSKLIPLRLNKNIKGEYLKKVEEVSLHIASDFGDDEKVKTAAQSRFLADQIRKML